MKKIELLIGCFILLLSTACQDDDEYVAPDTLSDISWYTSIHPGGLYVKTTGQYISFMDTSQGALTHEWSIDEGTHFLKGQFSSNDSLPLFIDPDVQKLSDKETVHVLFTEEGEKRVCLKNTFSEKVVFQSEEGPVESVKEGDLWVFTRCFEVDVIQDKLQPSFKVYKGEEEILSVSEDDMPDLSNSETWPIIDVEVNTSLKFVDLTTVGRPNARTWNISGTPGSSNDSIVEITFLKYGTLTNVGSLVSQRIDPLPVGTTSKPIPLRVNVIASSAPYEILGNVMENEEELLSLQLTGGVMASSLAGENVNFTVHVSNSVSGFEQDIAVESLGVRSDDDTFLELRLAEPIYNTDKILVSYIGGNIKSTDERILQPFTEKAVSPYFEESLVGNDPRFSFETEEDRGNGGNTAGWWSQHKPSFWSTDEIATAAGSRTMRYEVDAYENVPGKSNLWGPGDSFTSPIPAGSYRIAMKFYRPSGSTVYALRTIVNPPWTVLQWNFDDIPNDEWVTYYHDITTDGPMDKFDIQMEAADNVAVNGPQTFYIDDIQILALEPR
ncbi:hypothetical protein [Zobellia roscoffensis]|uniref:hypothetical protein n=1 Tax=Zobellia roscoffensis TaxID=2779508 RepID=UPI00188CC06D|nr:hypothetical protein [Zobellia roscoffensis]